MDATSWPLASDADVRMPATRTLTQVAGNVAPGHASRMSCLLEMGFREDTLQALVVPTTDTAHAADASAEWTLWQQQQLQHQHMLYQRQLFLQHHHHHQQAQAPAGHSPVSYSPAYSQQHSPDDMVDPSDDADYGLDMDELTRIPESFGDTSCDDDDEANTATMTDVARDDDHAMHWMGGNPRSPPGHAASSGVTVGAHRCQQHVQQRRSTSSSIAIPVVAAALKDNDDPDLSHRSPSKRRRSKPRPRVRSEPPAVIRQSPVFNMKNTSASMEAVPTWQSLVAEPSPPTSMPSSPSPPAQSPRSKKKGASKKKQKKKPAAGSSSSSTRKRTPTMRRRAAAAAAAAAAADASHAATPMSVGSSSDESGDDAAASGRSPKPKSSTASKQALFEKLHLKAKPVDQLLALGSPHHPHVLPSKSGDELGDEYIGRVNMEMYNMLWHYICERQRIWHVRNDGAPAPWTQDEILQRYHLCNVFREEDRGTRYFKAQVEARRIAAGGHVEPQDVLFMAVVYRLVNNQDSFERWPGGGIPQRSQLKQWCDWMQRQMDEKNQVFSGAHQNNGLRRYFQTVNQLDDELESYAKGVFAATTTHTAFKALRKVFGMGIFYSWQVLCDLHEIGLLSFAETNDWALVGPNAQLGMRFLWPALEKAPQKVCLALVKRLWSAQALEFERLGETFDARSGRTLSLKNMEHALCEFSKYAKLKTGNDTNQKLRKRNNARRSAPSTRASSPVASVKTTSSPPSPAVVADAHSGSVVASPVMG